MKKTNYFRFILLLMLMYPVALVVSSNEVIINHGDYFSGSVVTAEQVIGSITGLPDDNKIQVELGERRLISNTPVSIKKIDNTTALLSTQLEYEISSNIFTWYTYKDAYPQSYQKTDNQIEWLYLRTCTDWDHANGWWGEPRPVTDYHLSVEYNSLVLGDLNQSLGYQGYLSYNFSLNNEQVPENMIFNEQKISITTKDFYSVLTSAVISDSQIIPIGEYNEYYNTGSKGGLGAIEVSPMTYDSSIDGDFNLADAIGQNGLNIYIDGNQPFYNETPYDCQQTRLALTKGKDLTLSNMRSFISIQPDVTIRKQNIVGRTISTPYSLDIDTQSGTWFSLAGIVNNPVVRSIDVPRSISVYVQNYNFKNTYRLKFMIYSTLEIRSLNGSVIELDNPTLDIGNRYIDITFKGTTGADVTISQKESFLDGLNRFFSDLFSSVWGIVTFIIMIIAAIALIYLLIKLLPLLLRKATKKKIEKTKN